MGSEEKCKHLRCKLTQSTLDGHLNAVLNMHKQRTPTSISMYMRALCYRYWTVSNSNMSQLSLLL